MFGTRKRIGDLDLESAVVEIDEKVDDIQEVTESEILELKERYKESPISEKELYLEMETFEKKAEEIYLDFESVLISYDLLWKMKPKERQESMAIIRSGFPRFKKKYNITFEDAVAGAEKSPETPASSISEKDEVADSGFVATIKKMWNKFIEFLKGVWEKIKSLIFGSDEDKLKNTAATAAENAKNAAELTERLVSANIDEVQVKTDICAHLGKESSSKDFLKLLADFEKGIDGAIAVCEAYGKASDDANRLFRYLQENNQEKVNEVYNKLMQSIKKAYPDKPDSAVVEEYIKERYGVDVKAVGSEYWAFGNLSIKGIALFFWVDAVNKGELPNAKKIIPVLEKDSTVTMSVSDNEQVLKRISEVLQKWQKSYEEIKKNIAMISKMNEALCESLSNPNVKTAHEIKEHQKVSMVLLKATPKMAAEILMGFSSVVNELGEFSNAYDKACKEAVKKAVKEEAKENKEETKGSEDSTKDEKPKEEKPNS